MKHTHIVIAQISFLIIVGGLFYYFYPYVNQSIHGNIIFFNSENSQAIIFSKNPDFSNPKYVYFDQEEVYVQLEPGTYYWKAANDKLSGFENTIVITSETSLIITSRDNEQILQNIGTVTLNITKNKDGIMIGTIVLEEGDVEIIDDNGVYEGREI
mgnify:FL=1